MSKRLIYAEDATKTALEFFVEFLGGAFHENAQKELMARIQRLPSAQPTQNNTPNALKSLDCVDRQAAIDAVAELTSSMSVCTSVDECHGMKRMQGMAVRALDGLPSAQSQRIKGKWERKESDLSWWYECSECGESPLFDPYENEVLTRFCPWCGAEMRGDEDV